MPIDEKPSRNEDEYFLKHDAELLRQQRARRDTERSASARASHYMKCPKCGSDLTERERHDVKVDVCTDCGGMWLDAGELDLLRQADRGVFGRFFGSSSEHRSR